jgi:hypothetical protein
VTYNFGDSFDLYSAAADATNSYWDSGSGNASWIAGRFPGSRALYFSFGSNTVPLLVKSSGQNDNVHHLVVSYEDTTALSGTGVGSYLTLYDGATAQCTVVFRQDGAIILTSGLATGATIATFTGAVSAINTWFGFEFEIVVHPTAGSFAVRKNGNTSNDFSATALNTAPSGNAWANKLGVGGGTATNSYLDDLFWRSGSVSGSWLGDLRCYTRMPSSDVQATFSRTGTNATIVQQYPPSVYIYQGTGANFAFFTPITPAYSGTVTNTAIATAAAYPAGHMKCAIYADNGSGAPGALLAAADAPVTLTVAGTQAFTFSAGLPIVKGQQYWIACCVDVATTSFWPNAASGYSCYSATVTYSAFPQNNPAAAQASYAPIMQWTYTTASGNWQAVSEAQEDGLTSYVYDSNAGDADLYAIASIGTTPASVVATTARAYAQKSDAGTRTAAVQLKSGATTVASQTLALPTTFSWLWRTDLVDPNTGVAWTPAAVNSAQIGPIIIA